MVTTGINAERIPAYRVGADIVRAWQGQETVPGITTGGTENTRRHFPFLGSPSLPCQQGIEGTPEQGSRRMPDPEGREEQDLPPYGDRA